MKITATRYHDFQMENLNYDYYWHPEEFITGDNIEKLGDFVFDIDNYLIGDHGRPRTSKTEKNLIDEQIQKINDLKPRVIYTPGHDTSRFISRLDSIHHEFVLVTHNSDLGVLDEYSRFVDNKKIIKWFGQNNHLDHPKVITLPIGIAREEYPHGDVKLLSEKSKVQEKTHLVYKNFSISTNWQERTEADKITKSNGIDMSPSVPHEKYFDALAEAVFTISPCGNGVDCYRIWESLYLKTIPVVLRHKALKQFEDLPILFVNSWNEVTIDFLINNVKRVTGLSGKHEKLHYGYWQKLIKSI